jgi:hypothetical protein
MSDFHYFDQYLDREIDFTPYLTHTTEDNSFSYSFTNVQLVKTPLKNIFDKIIIVETFNKDISNFKFWVIDENERPENTAFDYYNKADLWWAVLLFNNITDVYRDWPVSESILAQQADLFFETEGKYPRNTYYDLLHEQNEKKRVIKLIKPEFINEVIAKFRMEFEKSLS